MKNTWSDADAIRAQKSFGNGDDNLGLLIYATRLLGAEPELALHGGGNTSLKTVVSTITGQRRPALLVKSSGADMGAATADQFVTLDLDYCASLRTLPDLDDGQMADEFRLHLLKTTENRPSIEALMHAFVPARVILHTHSSAILALTNRVDGEHCAAAGCPNTTVIPYVKVGFPLAAAVARAYEKNPAASGLIIMNHGVVTWGETVKTAYDAMIGLVSAAESYLSSKRTRSLPANPVSLDEAKLRYARFAPMIRGLLCPKNDSPDRPFQPTVLLPLIDADILRIIGSPAGREISLSQPLTPDYLIRTKRLPLWIDAPAFDNEDTFKACLIKAIADYAAEYRSFMTRYGSKEADILSNDLLPRVAVVPGLGTICAGPDAKAAGIARDIMRQALQIKALIWETGGTFRGIDDDHIYNMEFRALQRAKVDTGDLPLRGTIAVVTGAAGAIGSGISRALAAAGAQVAITDLPGPALDAAVQELSADYPNRVTGVALDVTDPQSVSAGFSSIVQTWGGVDLVIVNAGIAHVSPLKDLAIDAFRKLEKVNVEGTLLLLAEAGRLFKRQNTGGDIILISTKNVFAPGAGFGAYSATKAASHQLARIASLEMAEMGVRVNMVSPDAVFSDRAKKSGLWATVGPDRMRARGLDEKGLEEYYQKRNLLKARVTADHVANAVLFFATHQTPTTGATIPVDGGLPDSTPR